MRNFPATPVEMVASLWRNRSLIHASAKREVLGRYRGSVLGLPHATALPGSKRPAKDSQMFCNIKRRLASADFWRACA